MHPNALFVYQKHALPFFRDGMRFLEISPNGPNSEFRQATPQNVQWDTLGLGHADWLTHVAHEPYNYPVEANTYDVVLSGNVIEHVPHPWRWMPELARITKPGGLVVTVNPINWPYHEEPIDCWRIWPEGHKALCEEAGLTVEVAVADALESPVAHAIRYARSKLRGWKRPFISFKIRDCICVARKPQR